MGVWAWLRPGNRVWKVISDYDKGTITVYDEKGNLILEKKDLTGETMKLVEQNFLNVTATNLDAEDDPDKNAEDDGSSSESDPMYV